MGLFGPSKNEVIAERNRLFARVQELESLLTPELCGIDAQRTHQQELYQQNMALQSQHDQLVQANTELQAEIRAKQNQSMIIDDELAAEEFGLYKPQYDFANSTQYKDRLAEIRKEQKEAIKEINDRAKKTTWTVNNSIAKGRQMVLQTTKLLMRAYNDECENLIKKVKVTNITRSIEQIDKIAQSISKLGSVMGIMIPYPYRELKEQELKLAYEYALAKEKEKEEIRAAKELEREQKRVQKEIESRRKQLKKEKTKYTKALNDIQKQIDESSPDQLEALTEKKIELENNLAEIDKGIEDVDYRAANLRAGYVYIISNVGSFGDGVYKIGMTRRLEPMDRVRELGDASVPFGFDVHALIFSDDAPGLETALHQEFADRKVNLVNQRREFFRCSLDEIKEAVIKNYDKTVEFIDFPDAEQFRTSEKLRSMQ